MSTPAPDHSTDYSWADYLGYMEAGDGWFLPAGTGEKPAVAERSPVWGVGACVCIAGVSGLIARLPVWPFTLDGGRHPFDAVMFALVIGMLVRGWLSAPHWRRPGLRFVVNRVLPAGIMLLGARLDLRDLAALGLSGLVVGATLVAMALGGMHLLARRAGLGRNLATLLGVGTAICGGSAIIATAPVIQADEEDVAISVATVVLLGLVAMFLLPVLGAIAGLSQHTFGVWAGLTIHQTPQVLAAGFAYGSEAGEVATVVKLVRICLLAPTVFIIGILASRDHAHRHGSGTVRYHQMVPGFVYGLLGLALCRTLGVLPDATLHLPAESILGARTIALDTIAIAGTASKLCILLGMAAVGMETSVRMLRHSGPRALHLAGLVSLATLVLAYIAAVSVF